MSFNTSGTGVPPELLAQMEETARKALTGQRDPEAMRHACERMDRMREEIRKKHGLLNVGTPAIRQLRDR